MGVDVLSGSARLTDKRLLRIVDLVVGAACIILISLFFIALVLKVNAPISVSRAHMYAYGDVYDHAMVFDTVNKFIHAPSLVSIAHTLFDSSYQQYGRAYYVILAAVCFFPAHIWGDAGVIIALVFFHACVVYAACMLLVCTFIRSQTMRAVALLSVLFSPPILYYVTNFKPDPLQLLLIALFFFQIIRNKGKGYTPWFVLGLSAGVKGSSIIIIPLLVLLYCMHFKKERRSIIIICLCCFGGYLFGSPYIILCLFDPSLLNSYLTFMRQEIMKSNAAPSAVWAMIRGHYSHLPEFVVLLTGLSLGGIVSRRSRSANNLSRQSHDHLLDERAQDAIHSSILLVIGSFLLLSIVVIASSPFYLFSSYILVFVALYSLCEVYLTGQNMYSYIP